jgi:AraC-like DNA-binding protein
MKLFQPADYCPEVHYVNYISVQTGQVWGPRAIPDFELILIVDGRFSYADGENPLVLCVPGDVLCIPPGREHFLKNEATDGARAVISCIHLEMTNGNFLDGDYQLAAPPAVLTRTGGYPVVHELFKRCEQIYTGFSPNRAALLQAVAWEILLHLSEFQEGGTERLSPRMRDMLDFIQRHVLETLSRADLAHAFSISPEHVNALFRKELSSTPTQQIHRAKVFRAYTCLVHDGLTVKETAEKLGFYDEFHFSKIFKRIIGMPPSRVRPRPASIENCPRITK